MIEFVRHIHCSVPSGLLLRTGWNVCGANHKCAACLLCLDGIAVCSAGSFSAGGASTAACTSPPLLPTSLPVSLPARSLSRRLLLPQQRNVERHPVPSVQRVIAVCEPAQFAHRGRTRVVERHRRPARVRCACFTCLYASTCVLAACPAGYYCPTSGMSNGTANSEARVGSDT